MKLSTTEPRKLIPTALGNRDLPDDEQIVVFYHPLTRAESERYGEKFQGRSMKSQRKQQEAIFKTKLVRIEGFEIDGVPIQTADQFYAADVPVQLFVEIAEAIAGKVGQAQVDDEDLAGN